jgi:hypothetical protein
MNAWGTSGKELRMPFLGCCRSLETQKLKTFRIRYPKVSFRKELVVGKSLKVS